MGQRSSSPAGARRGSVCRLTWKRKGPPRRVPCSEGVCMERTRIEVPLDRFGFAGVPMKVPGFDEAHELVPDIDNGYVFEKAPFQILRAWWMSATREPIYIHGPWGCGKTSSVEQFFARLNVPVVPIMGRDPMEK